MGKKSLVVAVKESEYVERLADYIRHSAFGENWQLTAFTNPAALRGFVRGGYAIDLIVAQPGMLEELGELAEEVPTVAFVSILGQTGFESEVLQFQPLPQLLQAFLAAYAERGKQLPRPRAREEGPTVVSLFSASGGTGKTTLAMQLARQADIAGAKSFYLNLEQWHGFGEEDGGARRADESGGNEVVRADSGNGDDFAQLLYALQSSEQGASSVLARRKRHPEWGMDWIAPSGNPDERLSLSAEGAKKLIAAIADTGDYGCIVVDLDSRLDDVHAGIFAISNAVLWLTTPDAASMRKNRMALAYGKRKYGALWSGRESEFVFVQVGGSPGEWQRRDERMQRADVVLPYVEEWACGGRAGDTGAAAPRYRGAVESLVRQLGMA